jgi:hypothetical protein
MQLILTEVRGNGDTSPEPGIIRKENLHLDLIA